MTQRTSQINASFWLSLAAYAVGGVTLFLTTFWVGPFFSNLSELNPGPIRVVMFVGPFGWLAVAFLWALATLRVRSDTWKLLSVILFLCLVIGVN